MAHKSAANKKAILVVLPRLPSPGQDPRLEGELRAKLVAQFRPETSLNATTNETSSGLPSAGIKSARTVIRDGSLPYFPSVSYFPVNISHRRTPSPLQSTDLLRTALVGRSNII